MTKLNPPLTLKSKDGKLFVNDIPVHADSLINLSDLVRSEMKLIKPQYVFYVYSKDTEQGINIDHLADLLEVVNSDLWNDGSYSNICSLCSDVFVGHKRQPLCKSCCDSKIQIKLKPENGESDKIDEEIIWNEIYFSITQSQESVRSTVDKLKYKFTIKRK